MIIEGQQRPQRSGHSLSSAKEQLDRPDVTGDHRDRRKRNRAWVTCEMARGPDRQPSFPEIPQQRKKKSGPAEHAPHVFRTHIAAAAIANVLARPHPHEVITGCATPQKISAEGNPARFSQVRRLKLFDPRHAAQVMSFMDTNDFLHVLPCDWPEFRQIPPGVGNKKMNLLAPARY